MSTLHTGAAGELLVQYRLLKLGIDSARLTTDSGIDLVAYAPGTRVASTVQVKTQLAPVPAGGKGPLAVGWRFRHQLGADYLALVLLSEDLVWLFTQDEARELAQQHHPNDVRQLYWYVAEERRGAASRHVDDVAEYLLERRAPTLFPREPAPAG